MPEFPSRGSGLWLRFLLAGLAIVVLSAGVTATVGLNTVQGFVDDLKQGGTIRGAAAVITDAQAGDPQTLLLIGSDHRYGDDTRNARSDTMMLVRLDPQADVTTVLSIPRDLKVDFTVPGAGLRVGAKINETYTDGGEVLTAKVIRRLLRLDINHIVNVDFGGFRAAVDAIGCVYVDADRWYYHSNVGAVEQYAEIDVPAGYQRLCGQKALDYVRFRHADNDFVRAARQQDFLRQAKSQYGIDQFISDPHKLTRKIGKHMRTDAALQSKEEFLKLALLAGNSLSHPVRQVEFPTHYENAPGASYVVASEAELAQLRRQFLSPPPKVEPARRADGGRGQGKKRRGSGGPRLDGLVNAATEGADYAIQLGATKFPIYYPKLLNSGGAYMTPARNASGRLMYPRPYRIKAPDGKMKAAYRLVVQYGPLQDGNFYGIQGTTWTDPPILRNPSGDTRTINGKRLLLFYDGKRLRTVAWRTSRAVYWIQNTLQARLTNDQMLAIAGSLTRLGR